nr:hepatic lectin-like [Crassostrea gigas]
MFRLLYWILAAFPFYAHCLQRQTSYSRLYKEVANSSLAVLYGEDCSRVHCAGLCSEDDYCVKFLYSETSRQCIGLHCVKKEGYSYQYAVPDSGQMLLYEKEFIWLEYAGHYYFYGEELLTWTDAKVECQKICAHLVEIETKEESDWLAATFFDSCISDCSIWTGGNDIEIEGEYVWDHSNMKFSISYWSPGEPSIAYPDQASTRDCIDLFPTGRWNDRPCSFNKPFICEKNTK